MADSPEPFPDELLSSWLVRLAWENGLKLQSFCHMMFGRDRPIWNRDADKLADPELDTAHRILTRRDAIRQIDKEFFRPKLHLPQIVQKYLDLVSSFPKVEFTKAFLEQAVEDFRRDCFASPVPRLPHACVEVSQVGHDFSADIPNEVIEVPAFDPVFPSPA